MIEIRRNTHIPLLKRQIKPFPKLNEIIWRRFRLRYSITSTQVIIQCGVSYYPKGSLNPGIFLIIHFMFGYIWYLSFRRSLIGLWTRLDSSDELYRMICIGLPGFYKPGKSIRNLFLYKELYAFRSDFVRKMEYIKRQKARIKPLEDRSRAHDPHKIEVMDSRLLDKPVVVNGGG